MDLFWTIVAAILFISIGIPLIIYGGMFILIGLIYSFPIVVPWVIAFFCYIGGDQGGALIWFLIGIGGGLWLINIYSSKNKAKINKVYKKKRFKFKF